MDKINVNEFLKHNNINKISKEKEIECLAYWKQHLDADIPVLQLHTANQSSQGQNSHTSSQSLLLFYPLIQALENLSDQQGVNLFVTLLTALKILLYRFTGQEAIIFVSRYGDRTSRLLNLLLLRMNQACKLSFQELMGRVSELVLDIENSQYKDIPFEKITAELNLKQYFNHSSVFQVCLTYNPVELSSLKIEPTLLNETFAKFDLNLHVQKQNQFLQLDLVYNPQLFAPEQMAETLHQFQYLLEQIVNNPKTNISDFSLLTPTAKLLLPNPTEELVTTQWEGSVSTHLKEQAQRVPQNLAIVDGQVSWSYAELDCCSNQLANYLLESGIQSQDIIAIYGYRSASLVWALLGIIKAGAAFVILDPAYPVSRLIDCLDIAKPKGWLQLEAAGELPTDLLEFFQNSSCLCNLQLPSGSALAASSFLADYATEDPSVSIDPDDLLYIAFTSGSTGKPKGIVGTHRPLSHFLDWHCQRFAFYELDRFSMISGLAHDPLLRDIFTPIWIGATLCIPDTLVMETPGQLADWMQLQQVSVTHLTPAMGQLLAANTNKHITDKSQIKSLRYLFFSGDVVTNNDIARLRKLAPQATYVNFYGATETPQAMGYFIYSNSPNQAEESEATSLKYRLPLGRGIADVQLLLFNSIQQMAGIGELGEIYIRTPYLAKGYVGNNELTQERFITNPYTQISGDRLYKTGDLGRYLPNGNVEYLGRLDNQVKIRGFRIELGEIDAVLAQNSQIREAVVIVREDVPGDKQLVAYIVPQQDVVPKIGELRDLLQKKLPNYMMPVAFVMLEALPLTPNGKIDHRALPAPERVRPATAKTFIAPRNQWEMQLAKIWEEVLGIQPIGIEDNFFELGGHSLLATQIISRIQEFGNLKVTLRNLFKSPTIAALSKILESQEQSELGLEQQNIGFVSRNLGLPLSFSQERSWFFWQLSPNSNSYNLARVYRLTGQLHISALCQTWSEIVRRHEVLRTNFTPVNGKAIQIIHPSQAIETLPLVDIQNLLNDERQTAAENLIKEQVRKPFDLSVNPLWRLKLVRLAAEEHMLLITIHHIVFDNWSWSLLFEELTDLYAALSKNQPSPLLELPLQYADFAQWQRQWLNLDIINLQLNYWKQQLAGSPPILELPTDKPRTPSISDQGRTEYLELPKSLTEALKALSGQEGVTLFMTLLAAFQILLYRYSGQSDIVVGSPIAGRNCTQAEKMIGFFVNTLVLRTDLSNNPTFRELLGRVREVTLGAYEHQDIPFDKLVEALQPERSPSYHPLFQVMFVLQNAKKRSLQLPSLKVSPVQVDVGSSMFDLTLELEETPKGISGFFEYRTDLFKAETISLMVGHFQTLLEGIVAHPEQNIAKLPLLTTKEQQLLLRDWNDTAADFPCDKCIHQLFADRVAQNPEAVAVVFEGQNLTYGELNTKANQLAHYLRSLGVGPDVLVGICVERSLEMAVGFLGILKAGGAYVPLDPSYPPERLAFMLEDSQALVILTQERLLQVLPKDHRAKVVCLDTNWPEIAQQNAENSVVDMNSRHLAYVIYTSGSTGKPKGVMITHQGLVNHNLAIAKLFALEPSDRMLQCASISFDMAVEEIFPTWISGATLVLRDEEMLASTRNFQQFVEKEHITILDLPTALWHEIVNGMRLFGEFLPKSVRLLVVGGEKASREAYEHWWEIVGSRCRWINTYGPTENTISTTFYEPGANFKHAPNSEIPIGRPIANIQIYILDQQLQPVPIGVLGELYIGGAGVARGYLNCPDLTTSKFILNPFVRDANAYLYKTGDLVRYLNDGDIEFIGRIDYQAKIRGFRIELGEVEAIIGQHPKIKDNLVIVSEDVPEDKRLVSYVVPLAGQVITNNELRSFLKTKLPNYMIPSQFVILEKLLLTPNGKVDRRALPTPNSVRQEQVTESFVAPRNKLELQLLQIWQRVLGIQSIGVKDNFFELGGHSLLAVRLITEIENNLGKNLPLATLFRAQTVEQLAAVLTQEEETAYWSSLVSIQSSGAKSPLFCIHAVWGNVFFYQGLVRYLEPDQPVYGLQAQGLDGIQAPYTSITEMAAHYIREICTVQSNGPYFIGGHSFGGVVAFEIARQLHAQGQKIALLAIFDTSAPNYNEPTLVLDNVKTIKLANYILFHLRQLLRLKLKDQLTYIWERLEWHLTVGKANIFYKLYLRYIKRSLPDLRFIEIALANNIASKEYVPLVYSGKLTLFRASQRSEKFDLDADLGWNQLATGGVEIHELPGKHTSVMQEPNVKVLAEKLTGCLQQAQADSTLDNLMK